MAMDTPEEIDRENAAAARKRAANSKLFPSASELLGGKAFENGAFRIDLWLEEHGDDIKSALEAPQGSTTVFLPDEASRHEVTQFFTTLEYLVTEEKDSKGKPNGNLTISVHRP